MIEGIEWLFIALIIVLLVFYDPKKIPQIARAITQAKQEYEKAASMIAEEIKEIEKVTEEESVTPKKETPFPFDHEPESPDVHMIKWARMYKIQTYGKTRDELRREIFEKAREYIFGSKKEVLQEETAVKEEGEGAPEQEKEEHKSADEHNLRKVGENSKSDDYGDNEV